MGREFSIAHTDVSSLTLACLENVIFILNLMVDSDLIALIIIVRNNLFPSVRNKLNWYLST